MITASVYAALGLRLRLTCAIKLQYTTLTAWDNWQAIASDEHSPAIDPIQSSNRYEGTADTQDNTVYNRTQITSLLP